MKVETDDLGNFDQFDEIDPALTILDVGHERLMPPQRRRDGSLGHSDSFALLSNQLGKPKLPG